MKKSLKLALYALAFIVAFVFYAQLNKSFPCAYAADHLNVEWNDSVGTEVLDLSYGDGKFNKFDLYLPADNTRDSYGLVVFIHGGGFTGGDKRHDVRWHRYFTSKGFVSAGVNYTLRSFENAASLTQMTNDIKASVPVVVEEARKRGYPISKAALGGLSAGACLAMVYAYRDGAEAPVPVVCVIQLVGPTTFEPEVWGKGRFSNAQIEALAPVWLRLITGADITSEMMSSGDYKISLKEISPDALVDENTPPTLCAYGAQDKTVPFECAKRLTDAFDRYGVEYDYVEFPNSGHMLENDPEKMDLFFAKLDEYLDKRLTTEPDDGESEK